MKATDSFKITPEIRARKSEQGIWYLRHKDIYGNATEYSTGVEGNRRVIVAHVNDSGIKNLVAVAAAGCLTADTVARLTATRLKSIVIMLDEWEKWMADAGEATGTVISFGKRVLHFIEVSRAIRIGDVSISTINTFINPEDSHEKLTTRRARLTAVNCFMKYCLAKGYVLTNPAALVRINMRLMSHTQKEVKKKKTFTPQDLRKILAHVDMGITALESDLMNNTYTGERMAKREQNIQQRLDWLLFWGAASIIAHEVGLRIGDVAQLEWDCIGKDSITVWTDKKDRRVTVPFSMLNADLMRKAFTQFCIEKDKRFVFPVQRELAVADKIDRCCVNFRRMAEKAGVHGKTFHGFRHTRVQSWKAEGVSLETIADLVGHSNEDTTKGYL